MVFLPWNSRLDLLLKFGFWSESRRANSRESWDIRCRWNRIEKQTKGKLSKMNGQTPASNLALPSSESNRTYLVEYSLLRIIVSKEWNGNRSTVLELDDKSRLHQRCVFFHQTDLVLDNEEGDLQDVGMNRMVNREQLEICRENSVRCRSLGPWVMRVDVVPCLKSRLSERGVWVPLQ